MAMVNFSTMQDSFYDIIKAIVGSVTVIWEDEQGTRPNLPFVSMNYNTVSKIKEDYIGRPSGTGANTITGNREIMFSLQAIGTNSFSTLETIIMYMNIEAIKAACNTAGFVFIDSEPIQDLTGLEDTKWIERAQVDLRFRFSQEQADNVGLVKTVKDMEGKYKKGNTVVLTEKTTVTTI